MRKKLANLIMVASLVVIIIACGGGDEDGGSNKGNPINREPDVFNSNLSGYILSLNKGWLWKLDVATGRFIKVPNTNWADDDGYHNTSAFQLSPVAYEGDEFILRVRNCLPDGSNSSCLVTLDESANKTNQLVLPGRIPHAAKMSRDHQYIALTIQYGGSITNDTYLEIYDRSGNLVSDDLLGTSLVRSHFDWLPDGRLVYSHDEGNGRSIYVTLPYSTIVERQLRLPDSAQGKIRDVVANPDGTQLAFSLVTDSDFSSSKATPWVVNVDGTNLRQLAVDPHNEDDSENSRINTPKWSPDGKWILVRYNGASGGSVSNPGILGYLFAVPSDGVEVPLTPFDESIETTAIQIFSYWHAAFNEQPDSITNIERWPDMEYDWIR